MMGTKAISEHSPSRESSLSEDGIYSDRSLSRRTMICYKVFGQSTERCSSRHRQTKEISSEDDSDNLHAYLTVYGKSRNMLFLSSSLREVT